MTRVIVEYDIGERTCECGAPCLETDYEKLVTSTIWPGKQASLTFSELYKVGNRNSRLAQTIIG